MNVNRKGVKGLIKVIDDLQDRGFYCFLPFDDHSPVDLIAMGLDGKTQRIQIKYKELDLNLRTKSVVNGKSIQIDRNMIDGWAIYLAVEDRVVYLHKSRMDGKKSLNLDVDADYDDPSKW